MGVFCEALSLARTSKVDKELDALAARFTPRIKKAFLASVADIKDKAVITAITDAIAVGDLEAAFRATGLSAAAMRPITQMIETAFEQGGVTVANSAPKGITDGFGNRAVFRFDVRNSRSEAWLRDHSSSLVTRITEDTRGNIQSIIQRGVAEGRNPRNIALDIVGRVNPDTGRRTGGIIGLTAPQERWVGNARRDLTGVPSERYFTRVQRDKRFDSIVRKAIDTNTPLSPAKIDALVDKYSDNLLLQRGETIARTEAMQSLNKAADDAFRQAIDEGTLKPNAVTKAWDSAGDNRVRESHKAMDGQTVQMDEPFKSPDGAQLMFPGDTSLGAPASEIIDCRCRVRHAVDWFADLDDDDEAPPAPASRPVPPVPPAPTPAPPIPRITDVLDALPEPAPAPVPVNQFTYETFEPLPNLAAVKLWAEENIAREFHLTPRANLQGANEMARSILEVNERFGMGRLPFAGDPAQAAQYNFGNTSKTVAAYAESIDYLLFTSKPTDIKKLNSFKTTPERAAEFLSNARINAKINEDEYHGTVIAGLMRLSEILWTVSNTPASVVYHEMGHRLHGFNKFDINPLFKPDFKRKGWSNLISKYSGSNRDEYVAEAFSLYMQGDESQFWRIYPPLLDYFKKKDRKNVNN